MIQTNGFRFQSIWRKVTGVGPRVTHEEGSVLLEFGWVALVLSMFLIGIIYGGIMAYDRVVLSNAVATGARTLATELGDSTACSDATSAVTSTAYGLNSSQLNVVPQASIVFMSISTSGYAQDNTSTCSSLVGGDYAVMWASYPCSMNFPHFGIHLCSLTATTTPITYPPGGSSGSTITINVSCPSPPCIYAIESARISGTSQTSELSPPFDFLAGAISSSYAMLRRDGSDSPKDGGTDL